MKTTALTAALGLLLLELISPYADAAPFKVDTIALTGVDDARGPGLGAGVVYAPFGLSTIAYGPNGQFAYGAAMADSNIPSAVFAGTLNNVQPVVLAGDAAPGVPGATYAGVGGPIYLSDGTLTYSPQLINGGVTSATESASFAMGGSAPLIRTGDSALIPGNPLATIASYQPLVVGSGSHVSFFSLIQGLGVNATNDRVIYASDGTTLSLVVREGPGSATSGLAVNEYYNAPNSPQPGPGGGIVFGSEVLVSPSNSAAGTGLFHWNGSTIESILRTGDAVPLTDGTVASAGIISGASRYEKVAIGIGLSGGSVTPSTDTAYYTYSQSGLNPLVREGDAISSIPGATIRTLTELNPVRYGAGDVAAFKARIDLPGDPNNVALFLDKGGVWTDVVVGDYTILPGLNPGDRIGPTNAINFEVSENGAVAFTARIDRPTGFTDSDGLWYRAPNGEYTFLHDLREPFDTDPSGGIDSRTISIFQFGQFVDDRTFLATIFFTDNSSGIFSFTAVPEPTSFALVMLGGTAAIGLRRQRRL